MSVRRIFVEKKAGADVERQEVFEDIRENLQIASLSDLRVVLRYDVEGLTDEEFSAAKTTIFSEPMVDVCFEETLPADGFDVEFAVAFLPGQFDQRADSAAQCVQILTEKDKPLIRTAKVYLLKGSLSAEEIEKIKSYLINPVEAQETGLEKPASLDLIVTPPEKVKPVEGFVSMKDAQLADLLKTMGFAMDLDDLKFCQDYFKNTEHRDPSVTEMRMIDTYWSDHCRHTTFSTRLQNVEIQDETIQKAYDEYLKGREVVYEGRKYKDLCFMDIATLAAKKLKKEGKLSGLDESDEINACSIVEEVLIDGKPEQYLIQFKNETHNHPTEIEPFGGAATCLGGAIRDPLSGRAYVYQAMRITGAGDPRTSVADTLTGKLPQRKLVTTAAHGYSSYGNQIGLATGYVHEVYDEGYVAKRMEIGAVIGAVPKDHVVREVPEKGDVVVLLGGRTGRDGCGGATGSSKAHTDESLETCGAEVQKGNPPIERKIQRLFRKGEVTRLIKRCNDFGAGGVSVAIGELADGLMIDLDQVPKKYEGLDGTELAISESQERMAVVVAKEDADAFIAFAGEENLEACVVAQVTDTNRLTMQWQGDIIVDISRDFLNTNGAPKDTDILVEEMPYNSTIRTCVERGNSAREGVTNVLSDLNVASQKGLVERFDSTIGANTVLMPFGGKYQLTPSVAMAAKVPTLQGDSQTATLMAYGYNPKIALRNPYLSAIYAVVDSVAKTVAAGGDYERAYLTLQEYFEKPYNDKKRWGKPFSALLGAYTAQTELGIAAIGGKDSMSGSFNELDVPPTLVSFAVCTADVEHVVSNEFKAAGHKVLALPAKFDGKGNLDFSRLKESFQIVARWNKAGAVKSATTVGFGGIVEAVCLSAFGNKIGFAFNEGLPFDYDLYSAEYGTILVEVEKDFEPDFENVLTVGFTNSSDFIELHGEAMKLDELIGLWEKPLKKVYPITAKPEDKPILDLSSDHKTAAVCKNKVAQPRVFLPVFPGTNCEYDTKKAFEAVGAQVDTFVINNLSSDGIKQSVAEMAKRIGQSQIIMLSGGFSAGDEPDGSGKFIATFFRNPYVREATMELLQSRDGLMLGICNGFQALIKLGLVPYGEIRDLDESCPTLTYNTIGRHISTMATTKVCSNLSVWLSGSQVGDVHKVAISHGEGRFAASEELVRELHQNGQIATQYVDLAGNVSGDPQHNANCSAYAIEGITSADGRIFGKMGHSERIGRGLYRNIVGETDQKIFESGVKYFQ